MENQKLNQIREEVRQKANRQILNTEMQKTLGTIMETCNTLLDSTYHQLKTAYPWLSDEKALELAVLHAKTIMDASKDTIDRFSELP